VLASGRRPPGLLCRATAAKWAVIGFMYNSGQVCGAGSRVYVQESVYDAFLALLVQRAKELPVGDGFDWANSLGPVASKAQVRPALPHLFGSLSTFQYERVWSYIESGKAEGARVVLGGEKRDSKGFFVDPTIFVDIRPEMKIVKEEVRP
jgi:aldehyde dehydrogenase (NAD+)